MITFFKDLTNEEDLTLIKQSETYRDKIGALKELIEIGSPKVNTDQLTQNFLMLKEAQSNVNMTIREKLIPQHILAFGVSWSWWSNGAGKRIMIDVDERHPNFTQVAQILNDAGYQTVMLK